MADEMRRRRDEIFHLISIKMKRSAKIESIIYHEMLSNLFAGGVIEVEVPTSSTDVGPAMEFPDGDFHNFSDRSPWKFEKCQGWAVYDEQYGMPRLYAIVDRIVSKEAIQGGVALARLQKQ
ncbi:hypothetical protein QQ045_000036 [Rhodiola kirilowii]